MPVHISHIKALGVDVQGKAPDDHRQDRRGARGGRQHHRQPISLVSASGTSLVASLVPLWAQDGGRAALLKRFDDPALQPKLRADMAENMRKRGGAATSC